MREGGRNDAAPCTELLEFPLQFPFLFWILSCLLFILSFLCTWLSSHHLHWTLSWREEMAARYTFSLSRESRMVLDLFSFFRRRCRREGWGRSIFVRLYVLDMAPGLLLPPKVQCSLPLHYGIHLPTTLHDYSLNLTSILCPNTGNTDFVGSRPFNSATCPKFVMARGISLLVHWQLTFLSNERCPFYGHCLIVLAHMKRQATVLMKLS